MNSLVPCIWAAGVAHLVIAAANFVLPRKLDYAENLSRLSRIVAQVFVVHSVFIVLMLLAFSAACFLFAADLAGGSALGRFVSGFIGFFWLLRVLIQFFYYDPEIRRQHRGADIGFAAAFLALGLFFTTVAVIGPGTMASAAPVVAPGTAARAFDLLLWAAGLAHFAVLAVSFQVPARLGWKRDLPKLMPFNRKLMWTYSGYIVLCILSFGILTLVLHDEFLHGEPAALGLAAFIGVFWAIRVVLDFCWFGHDDWPRGRMFVIGHVLFTLLLIGLAGTYLGLTVWHLAGG